MTRCHNPENDEKVHDTLLKTSIAQLTRVQSRVAQIEKAIAAGQAHANSQRLAVAGYFDAESGKVVIQFENGAEFRFPSKLGQGLKDASEAAISNIKISPSGLGIHWPNIDVGLSIPHLLEGIYGTKRWMSSVGSQKDGIVSGSK
ncbi:MAG: DUF2442 domain-containing protein [Phormidesmis sp.]